MTWLWILLAILGGLLLLVLFLLLFGKASVHITCCEQVRVVLTILGILSIPLISEKKEPKPRICRDPKRVLRRERKKAKLAAKKTQKKNLRARQKAAQKKVAAKSNRPKPNLLDNIAMVTALIKELYRKTNGKIVLRVKRMHLYVSSSDAANTAFIYAAILQAAVYLFEWIERKFTHILRKDGAMQIIPDFVSGKMRADIDISVGIHFRHAIPLALALLKAYKRESRLALKKAMQRASEAQTKAQ